jgi:hypothetical protein
LIEGEVPVLEEKGRNGVLDMRKVTGNMGLGETPYLIPAKSNENLKDRIRLNIYENIGMSK